MSDRSKPATTASSRYRVQAVVRALDVLALLGNDPGGGGLSVTEIAGELGISKSAAFATLHTLVEGGHLATSGEGPTKRYRLGPALIRLGARARAQISLTDLARPHLIALTKQSHAASRLAVLESGEVVVIDQVAAESTNRVDLRMGARELLHSTGLGKAILAALPDAGVRNLLSGTDLTARTAKTITTMDALTEELEHVADVGYAIDDEEDSDGIFCIGAAIRDHAADCVGAISITGLKLHQSAAFYRRLGRLVQTHAAAVSNALGYVEPS